MVLWQFGVVRKVGKLKKLSLPAGTPGLCAELTERNQNSLIESNHPVFKHLSMWAKRKSKGDD